MPRVLGIDSSLTAAGLCRVDVHREANGIGITVSMDVATVGAPKPTKDKSKRAMVRRVNALMAQIEQAIIDRSHFPDLIAIESLAYGAKGEGAWVLPWIFGRCCELAENYDVPLIVVGTSQVKKYATGKGNADKDAVLAAAIKLLPGADIANNNEGDAAIIGAVGCHYLGYPILAETDYRADVMDKISN